MKEMAVGELKAQFSTILEEVKQGEKVGILYGKAKKPVAMIVPYREEKKGRRKIGILDGKAKFRITGDGKISEEEFLGI
jgi:antitoxin (DNA-binding transcriptional repressor) of toxin-antitoxin stability system